MHVFSHEAEETALRRHTVEQFLEPALLENRLIKHYQPLVATDGSRIVVFEALARRQHDELGSVSPGDFVPIAEKNARLSRLAMGACFLVALERLHRLQPGGGDATAPRATDPDPVEIRLRDKVVKITVSVGCAQMGQDGDDMDSLMCIGDQRLYEAKALGRDRVVAGADVLRSVQG